MERKTVACGRWQGTIILKLIMLNREEYDLLIRTFLVELNRLCADASDQHLRAMPRLQKEIDSYLVDLQDLTNDAARALRTAFAYVDEYIGADWQKVIETGHEAYILGQRKASKPE